MFAPPPPSDQSVVPYPSLQSPTSPPPPTSFVEVELQPLTRKEFYENQDQRGPDDPTPEEEREKNRIEALVHFYAGIYKDLYLSHQINAGLLSLVVLIEWAIYSAVK